MPDADEKTLDQVYEDRNLLACALARATNGFTGRAPDPENPDEWAIVFIETPFGQVSWHVPLDMAKRLNVPRRQYEWDGHDRERKNEVLATWTQAGCET